MSYLEHPSVEKMNRDGFLGTIEQETVMGTCMSCEATLKQGDTVVEFQDHLFCDAECLTESFSENPEAFGMMKTKLS